jgi:hypothetical protein
MLKAVVLLKRKSGMNREAFIEHYEKRHVPLVRRLLPTIGKYVRNYLDDAQRSVSQARQGAAEATSPAPYFDVITEIWFEDRNAYDQFLADLNNPQKSSELQQDEERFLDRSIVQTFEVAEYGA